MRVGREVISRYSEVNVRVDWMKATEDERKVLYRVARAIANKTNTDILGVIVQAKDTPMRRGTGCETNFNPGKIWRQLAKVIAECIEEHHRDLAHDTAPELFPISASTIWSEYLADHGLAGQLHIQSKSRGRDPVTFEAKATSGHHVLALGEPFALRLENSRPGSCMGYQIYREKWYLFQLTTSEGYLQTDGGQITLPQEANGRPVHMIEREHRGVHHFVIVVADQGAGRVYLKRPIGLRGR